MAEDKKPLKGGGNSTAIEQLVFMLVGLLLLGMAYTALLRYLGRFDLDGVSPWGVVSNYFFSNIWPVWKLVAAVLSSLCLTGTIYSLIKLRAINIEENKIYNPPINSGVSSVSSKAQTKNERWERITKHANSPNSSEWKLAIMEADVLLGELLEANGFVGESVGEMLKSADRGSFVSLENAWEAHKVRNIIAHNGSNFQLTERETRRVISLFESVFKEFQAI